MRGTMDNFLNSLLSSPSWADMNESASRLWVGSNTSQTDSLLADSMESFQVDRKNSGIPMLPSNHILGNGTAENLAMAHDNSLSIFTDGGLKYGISEGPFLAGNLPGSRLSNLNSQLSQVNETSEGSFSIPDTVACNSGSIPYGHELGSSLQHSALTNPSSLESSGSEPHTYAHPIGEAHSMSSVPTLWPASYSGVSSLGGQEKAENFSFHGIPNGTELLRKNQNEISSNLVNFASGQPMNMADANSSPHYQGTTEATSLHLPGFSSVSQMSFGKTAGMQTSTQFEENSFKHQLGHSSSSHQQITQSVGCNVASKPRVRARRGQATDPHSIAERLRREKIAERMKNLQELVPNSNKTDKASMLDEIIDYVKFLQLQVKVLSMSRLGAAGAVVPLITDTQTEDTGSLNLSSISQVVDLLDSEQNLAFEQEVVKLMESSVTNAMQYLQNRGFCLMPIALATAISSQKISSSATLLDQRKHDASERNDRNNDDMVVKQEESTTSSFNGR